MTRFPGCLVAFGSVCLSLKCRKEKENVAHRMNLSVTGIEKKREREKTSLPVGSPWPYLLKLLEDEW